MKRVIAICGKSGSGKDTIVKEILKRYPNLFKPIVSYTTRPRRENEKEGIDYYFITKSEMANKIVNNEMLEVSEFNNWFYGTAINSLSDDCINIGVYNLDGLEYLCQNEQDIDNLIFYINTSDKTRLIRSLNREEHPDVDEIVRRYGTDKNDFNSFDVRECDGIELQNEKEEDLDKCITSIVTTAKKYFQI
jgi:guanylate kinase